jgi:hypothetical protein
MSEKLTQKIGELEAQLGNKEKNMESLKVQAG